MNAIFRPFTELEDQKTGIDSRFAEPAIDAIATPEARRIVAAHRRALSGDKPVPPARGTRARLIYEAGQRIGVCI